MNLHTSPLEICSMLGLLPIIELLLSYGATAFKTQDSFEFRYACDNNHFDVARFWFERSTTNYGVDSPQGIQIMAEIGADFAGEVVTWSSLEMFDFNMESTVFFIDHEA